MAYSTITDLPTPSLLLDLGKMDKNIRRMSDRIMAMGCDLRPHVKTHKSIDATHRILEASGSRAITVSTLHEANYFFARGIRDILYGVGISPNKFEQVATLMAEGCDLKVILDSVEMAQRLATDGERRGIKYKVYIELDTDGHRSGASVDGQELLLIGKILDESVGAALIGVMTHAGGSYACTTPSALLNHARKERDLSVLAAQRLREAGYECPEVSIGSTPTALAVDHLNGITEVRAGVYVFFDLVMAGIGVCQVEDIALSVATSVIGFQKEKSWVVTDSGWMAMSRDRGTQNQEIDYGYGLVLDQHGTPFDGLIVSQANQEHGVISSRNGTLPYDKLQIGDMLRVVPNHACATGAQYDRYFVVEGDKVIGDWPRINGWGALV